MNMVVLQCEMCCGDLEISPDRSIGICKYCGSTFTIPSAVERKGNLFNRANYLRQNCDFDKAINVYESILAENCDDADALWGLVLCRYGIEYVEDPKTHSRIPTCHRTSRTSILSDADFKSALRYADEEKRTVYQMQARRIDQIQNEILRLSDSQEKYDVFICYKETDDSGERTVDSVLAQELYQELSNMKIKTFYARKTLEGKVGAHYEPIIFSALSSAGVMIVLGTKPSYFEATWVKNEWSRYLDFMKEDPNKHLIPAYRDMSAYQLPEEFMSIQAVDMSRIGFKLDLCDGVRKLLRKHETQENMGSAPISKESLYSRAMVFLGNREFYKAVDYFDKVLDIDPKYARAYWGSLLASYQCATDHELISCNSDDWTDDARLKNAIQFANPEEKQLYDDTVSKRVVNFKKLANAALESKDFEKSQDWCDKYIHKDQQDGGIWWVKLLAMNGACNSNELFDQCLKNTVSIIDSEEYKKATQYSIEEESMMYEKTAKKIEEAVSEKKRNLAYEECGTYMKQAVDALKRKLRQSIAEQWRDCQREADALRNYKNHKGKLYRNNFYSFLLQTLFWASTLYVIAGLVAIGNGDAESFLLSFLILWGLTMGIVVLVCVCMAISVRKRVSDLARECCEVSEKLKHDRQVIEITEKQEKKARSLLEQYLLQTDLSIEQINAKRHEFDHACQSIRQSAQGL